jgi:hypothetical protein
MKTLPSRGPLARLAIPALVLAFFAAGCGRGAGGREIMRLPEHGVSITAPAGWRVDTRQPSLSSRGDCTGLLLAEPLAGRPFLSAADALSTEFGARSGFRRETTVGGNRAVHAIIDPPGGARVMRLYVEQGDYLVYVSYAVPREEFAAEEAALLASLDTIRFGR